MRRSTKRSRTNMRNGTLRRRAVSRRQSIPRRPPMFGKRSRGGPHTLKVPFSPPEDWHEPAEGSNKKDPYEVRFVVQSPGPGYRHILTPEEIRARLRQLPPEMVAPLEVIQLSRMTRKKEMFACYGMQWGTCVYLYPMEKSLVEAHCRPPVPSQFAEAEMYGGCWVPKGHNTWELRWSEAAIQDFYLNNILIHEIGHLLDERNEGYLARERYAEWFAIEWGYRRTPRGEFRPRRRKVTRRHHAV